MAAFSGSFRGKNVYSHDGDTLVLNAGSYFTLGRGIVLEKGLIDGCSTFQEFKRAFDIASYIGQE